MGKHFTNRTDFEARVDYFERMGKPFTLTLQGNSRVLDCSGIKWYCYSVRARGKEKYEDRLPTNEIGFISKVKKHIIENGLDSGVPKSYESKDEIKFIDYNKGIAIGSKFSRCFCIDINSAYWDAAKMFGYITEGLHKEGLTKDKRVRLACLGTFAKVISTIEFDGVKETFLDDILPDYLL